MQQIKLLKGSIHVQSSFATAWKSEKEIQAALILNSQEI